MIVSIDAQAQAGGYFVTVWEATPAPPPLLTFTPDGKVKITEHSASIRCAWTATVGTPEELAEFVASAWRGEADQRVTA